MSDAHSGIPHDLPEYEPNTNPPKWRVQVYRSASGWGGTHQCSPRTTVKYGGHRDWATAYAVALDHARRCR